MSSDYLYVRPSFFHGMARTLDVFGSLNLFNWSRTQEEADTMAMYVDWSMVGEDLATAMEAFSVDTHDAQMPLFASAE